MQSSDRSRAMNFVLTLIVRVLLADTLREETDSFLKRKDEWKYVTLH